MNMLPVKWEAMKRGVEFWVQEDEIGGVWVARIGHVGIEWNVTE